MRYPCAVVSSVQSHVFRQISQSLFDFFQDIRYRRYIIDVRRLDVYVDYYIILAVHCPVFAVVKSIRLPIPALLAALRIRRTLHSFRCSASSRRIVIPIKRFLLQCFPILVHLLIQLFQICFRRFFYRYQSLLMFVCLRFDVCRIRILYCASNQSFFYALPQDFIEYLLGNIVVPESSDPVLADRTCIRRFLCQPQSAEPFVSHIVVDLFFDPGF